MEGCSSKENCRGWCDFFKPFIHAHLLGVMRTLLAFALAAFASGTTSKMSFSEERQRLLISWIDDALSRRYASTSGNN